ncbi:MAG: M14 family metallopeptidase [bacterium]|nr:M14 family metallopeptidase [bacterium]
MDKYYIKDNNNLIAISNKYIDYAKNIDVNRDHILDDNEIVDFLVKNDDFKIYATDKGIEFVNKDNIIQDFKLFLRDKIKGPDFIRDYNQIINKMKELEQKYPDKVKLEYLGKTFEGRDIVAMRISKNINDEEGKKKSILITGLHHAREWATGESALNIAEKLLESNDNELNNYLNDLDIYILPVVNPDGYEYSLKEYAWWRKNKKTFENGMGVDLNRNYFTPKDPTLYRQPNDKPDNTWDDYGASDSVYSDTYRGPYGNSEEEIKAITKLVNSKHIDTVIDIHSYGNMILYPWGYTNNPTEIDQIYEEVAKEMNSFVNNSFRVMQAIKLYPTTGSSLDYHHKEGRFSYTFEIGNSFFPKSKEELDSQKQKVLTMVKIFMKNLSAGKIPTQKYIVSK